LIRFKRNNAGGGAPFFILLSGLKNADYFRHDHQFENPLRVGFAMLLRIMVAGMFSAYIVASCSGVAARFFPHGLRPRRRDARARKPGCNFNIPSVKDSAGRKEGTRFLDLDGQDV
jgi:hypothetical protein